MPLLLSVKPLLDNYLSLMLKRNPVAILLELPFGSMVGCKRMLEILFFSRKAKLFTLAT